MANYPNLAKFVGEKRCLKFIIFDLEVQKYQLPLPSWKAVLYILKKNIMAQNNRKCKKLPE